MSKSSKSVDSKGQRPGDDGAAKDAATGTGSNTNSPAPEATGAATLPPRQVKKRGIGVAVFLWGFVLLAIIGGAGYATWPFWLPHLTANLPEALKEPFKDPRLDGLAERLKTLEDLAKERQSTGDAIQDLESERARFTEELKVLLGRVNALENTSESIKEMVATATGGTRGDAEEALRKIAERLTRLEKEDAALASTGEALQGLESRSARLSTSVADITERITALESMDSAEAAARKSAHAVVLAVGQLQGALRASGPFAKELGSLKAVTDGDSRIDGALAALEPHAASGIPDLEVLRRRFEKVAGDTVRAANAGEDTGWVRLTLNRLASLVTIRRTDGTADDSIDAVVAGVENDLESGDLITAVEALADLSGAPAEAVAGWLGDARARLTAERALADLHVHAVSLVKPSAE
jgi:hypothetical protein